MSSGLALYQVPLLADRFLHLSAHSFHKCKLNSYSGPCPGLPSPIYNGVPSLILDCIPLLCPQYTHRQARLRASQHQPHRVAGGRGPRPHPHPRAGAEAPETWWKSFLPVTLISSQMPVTARIKLSPGQGHLGSVSRACKHSSAALFVPVGAAVLISIAMVRTRRP